MNKTTLLVLAISLSITTVISTLFGFAGSAIIGTFWAWFWVSLLIQVIGFAVVNSFLIQRDNALAQVAEIEALDRYTKFTVKLNCAYCQQPNTTPIQLDIKNTFKCESCNQINGVSMQFLATTLTSPIESVKIPIDDSTIAEFKVSR